MLVMSEVVGGKIDVTIDGKLLTLDIIRVKGCQVRIGFEDPDRNFRILRRGAKKREPDSVPLQSVSNPESPDHRRVSARAEKVRSEMLSMSEACVSRPSG